MYCVNLYFVYLDIVRNRFVLALTKSFLSACCKYHVFYCKNKMDRIRFVPWVIAKKATNNLWGLFGVFSYRVHILTRSEANVVCWLGEKDFTTSDATDKIQQMTTCPGITTLQLALLGMKRRGCNLWSFDETWRTCVGWRDKSTAKLQARDRLNTFTCKRYPFEI